MNRTHILAAIAACSLLASCGESSTTQPTPQDIEADKGAAAAQSLTFASNAERDNIVKRLKLTSDPGLIGFVVLMNQAGQPILYTSVKGKITSSGKRLTKPEKIECLDYPSSSSNGCSYQTVEAPNDEGTFGHSGEYVFFWTADGQYIQWNGPYLYSDKPFRLRVDPIAVASVGEDYKPKAQ